jgi:hypothetical protein
VRVKVNEDLQPLAQQGDADLLVAAALDEFLDAAIGEVHLRERGRDDLALLRLVHRVRADRR